MLKAALGSALAVAAAGVVACSPPPDPGEASMETVTRMIEAVNDRDFDALDDVIAANVRRHSGATPGVVVESLDDFKAFLRTDIAASPDSRQEVNFMFADGEWVAVHATYTGIQDGVMGPFPPSGKTMELPFIGILRLENGKIAEIWVEWDNMNALTQLGHFPPPGAEAP